jgi:fatty acid amide hydrolase 2
MIETIPEPPQSGSAQPQLTRMSALELARAIAQREVSAREVVQEHIFVLQRNRRLNAMARDRFDEAYAEAEAVDRRIAHAKPGEELPPLLGVPVVIKELIAVKGMPNSAGFLHRRRYLSREDAPVVARLREAGAIVLGVTNSAGPLFWVETNNPFYGRANNPYDLRRTAGGSSGGDGAAVAVGGAPIAVGSDLGGSLRIPAFFNGVFAHMPSAGMVPITGHFPVLNGEPRRALFLGPITRKAEDLEPTLRAIAGPDGSDPGMKLLPVRSAASVNMKGLPVVVSTSSSVVPLTAEIERARVFAAQALEQAGAHVREVPFTSLRWTVARAVAVLSQLDFAGTLADLMATTALNRSVRGQGVRALVPALLSAPVAVLALAERAPARAVRTRATRRLISSAQRASEEIQNAIGHGVLLHPPFPRIAPRHYTTYGQPWLLGNTIAFNILGLPVTQVPLGLGRKGIPLGVQVAAAPGNDHAAIRVALELERVFGGWVPPEQAG